MSDGFKKDEWLSEVMNRSVFRWTGTTDSIANDSLKLEMTRASFANGGFFYVKWPIQNVAGMAILTRMGFSVVDTPITFEWRGDLPKTPSLSEIVPAGERHFGELADVAENCFRYSRFHLDPNIPKKVADLVKRRWIENYFIGKRGSALYVALVQGRVAGFLGVVEATDDSKEIAVIDLIGVSTPYQGQSIGSNLVYYFIREWRERVASLRVGTQAANIPSLRLYEKTGFQIVSSQYVLHAHVLPGGVLI